MVLLQISSIPHYKESDRSSEMNFAYIFQNALSGKDQCVRCGKLSDLVSVSGEVTFLHFDFAVDTACNVYESHRLFFGSSVGTCDSGYGYANIGFGYGSTALCHLGSNLG